MFIAGFLFDFLTMQRIDAWRDLAVQLAYLAAVTVLLVLQQREAAAAWLPGARIARWWRFNVDALHFLYGGLLSAYVVLYFRSTTFGAPALFLSLLVLVMLLNEVPRVRGMGHELRLGLYAFCVLSFLTYFIPIVVGRIGGLIFLLSLAASALLVWHVTRWLVPGEADRRAARRRLFAPAGVVLAAVAILYVLRLIPPVPLSVQFQGVYHDVRRDAGGYTLQYEAPPVWAPWRHDSRPFTRRAGDRLHYFVRVFAPAGFTHRVVVRWETYDDAGGRWRTTDRITVAVAGGRSEGFRGTATKGNFMAGRWRVTAETEDGRALATLSFRVDEDARTEERRWREVRG